MNATKRYHSYFNDVGCIHHQEETYRITHRILRLFLDLFQNPTPHALVQISLCDLLQNYYACSQCVWY